MKRLLIVIDYQNDFVSGSLGFNDAIILEDYLVELIKKYHLNKDDVIFTYDSHQDNYLDTQEGKNLPVTHCIENSEGWQLCDTEALCPCHKERYGTFRCGAGVL